MEEKINGYNSVITLNKGGVTITNRKGNPKRAKQIVKNLNKELKKLEDEELLRLKVMR